MFYEAQISRIGVDENGKEKKFNEKYLTDALSIAEAVTRFESEISILYPEHETRSIKRVGYSEVLTDENADNRYFHVTYNTIVPDEKGKDKKTAVAILIQANDFDEAKSKYAEAVKGYMVDVELVKLTETKILEYFPYKTLASSENNS